MSGRKNSDTLFHLLTRQVPWLPFRVELIAVHLDQVQPATTAAARGRYYVPFAMNADFPFRSESAAMSEDIMCDSIQNISFIHENREE